LDVYVNSQPSAANFYDHRIIWFAVVISVAAHFFALSWWSINRPVAESILSAVTEFNLEVVNLALIPEPTNFLRPTVPEIPPVMEPSEPEAASVAEAAENEVVNPPENDSTSARPLRFDALTIQEAVSSVELPSNLEDGREIPANELSFPERSGPPADSTYINAQGNQVVMVDGKCFIVSAQTDQITHGKQVFMQMGGGCPYVPSLSEEMTKNITEKVCSRFGCD
jgi:hypothetical protein